MNERERQLLEEILDAIEAIVLEKQTGRFSVGSAKIALPQLTARLNEARHKDEFCPDPENCELKNGR